MSRPEDSYPVTRTDHCFHEEAWHNFLASADASFLKLPIRQGIRLRRYSDSLYYNMVGPTTASLTPLSRTDGSASFKCPSTGFNILGSVNAPVELPGRRDALKPEEATVEAFVKPGTYPGGVAERYVEGILKGVLEKLVLGREKGFPRRGVALTLAVVGGESEGRGDSVGVLLWLFEHS